MGKIFMLWIKNWIKNLWNKKTEWLILIFLTVVMVIIGILFPMVYGFNDDSMMKSILSGDYTGTPNGHAVYMRYPLTGVLSSLYRFNHNIPWFTLFFAVCIGGCVFLILDLTIKKVKGWFYKIFAGILVAEVLLLLLIRQYIIMHYTIIAALLGGTALFLLTVSEKKEIEEEIKKEIKLAKFSFSFYQSSIKIGSLFLFYLCYMVRSQIFYLTLPFLLIALLWQFVSFPIKIKRKEKGKKQIYQTYQFYQSVIYQSIQYLTILLIGILILLGIHKIMYSSEDWQQYEEYNNARTQLYDYTDILPYEEYQDIYEEIGITEQQYFLLKQYNIILDEEISTEQIRQLAQAAKKVRMQQISFLELFKKRFQEYYYRTLHQEDFPYNIVVILFYIITAIFCIKKKQWFRLLLLGCLGGGRSTIWLYLMMQGRYPTRIIISLYLIEGFLLAGMCLQFIGQSANSSKFTNFNNLVKSSQLDKSVKFIQFAKGRKLWMLFICKIVLIMGICFCVPYIWQEVQQTKEESEQQLTVQKEWEELRSYIQDRKDQFFYIDVYSVVSVSGMQYETTDYENYMLLGGWMTRSVLQKEKQKQIGYSSVAEAFALGEEVFLVMDKNRSHKQLEEYLASIGYSVQFQVADKIGRFYIYRGIPIEDTALYNSKMDICYQEVQHLKQENYQAVFLSMYPLDTYAEEDFVTYRGLKTLKSQLVLENKVEWLGVLTEVLENSADLDTIYLGIDPGKLEGNLAQFEKEEWAKQNFLFLTEYPQIHFEVLLSYPSMESWLAMTEQEVQETLVKYKEAEQYLSSLENTVVFYPGCEEWLICNSSNYKEKGVLQEDVAKNLMLETFCDDNFQVESQNAGEKTNQLEKLIDDWRENPPVILEKTDSIFVFLGDSIIGNYEGSLSVPGVVGNFTKAKVINCGYGGICASKGEDVLVSMNDVVDSLIDKNADNLPEGIPAHNGVLEFAQSNLEEYKVVFFFYYGVNDYINGHPIESENRYDEYTYLGAMRSAIEKLKKAYSQAELVIMTPIFLAGFSNGTEKMGKGKQVLIDYVDAALLVAQEYGVYSINHYTDMKINAQNQQLYLTDGCHPNQKGRFEMGLLICNKLNEISESVNFH